MIQSNRSTASRAVFTSAWIEFCRTGEGRHEYRRRFGDYLFTEPRPRSPRALSLPPLRRPRSGRRRRTLRPPTPGVERVSIERAAVILGPPLRTVQALAARGEIPGAAKIGGRWTFDIEKLRRLVRQRERETWQSGRRRPDATGGEYLWARTQVRGREVRWSLHTSDPAIARTNTKLGGNG